MPITPREYLSKFAERMPDWLAKYNQKDHFNATDFLKSRTVFYPGAGRDGHPFTVFGASHAAHCFVYADYGITKESILSSLAPDSAHKLQGYKLAVQQDLTVHALAPSGWRPHVDIVELPESSKDWIKHYMSTNGVKPYGLLCIFDRENRYTDAHGPERLALIYLGADGIATYDALYCQPSCLAPYGLLLQDHGFGGNYDKFGSGGLMERIAIKTRVFPEWILSDRDEWAGFNRIFDLEGSHGGQYNEERFLFSRNIVDRPVNSR